MGIREDEGTKANRRWMSQPIGWYGSKSQAEVGFQQWLIQSGGPVIIWLNNGQRIRVKLRELNSDQMTAIRNRATV